jgi:D-alanine-D-alanine ligase
MKANTKILICYNAPVSVFPVYNGKPSGAEKAMDDLSEVSFMKEIGKIVRSLKKNFDEVDTLSITRDVQRTIKELQEFSPDVIFNFVESVEGIASYEFSMAALFELLNYEFTGNSPITLGNCLNKERTKNILRNIGINTPRSGILRYASKSTRKPKGMKYPLILKLLKEDASIGISEFSVVKNNEELRKQISFLFKTYRQDVLAEEYIEGREINAAVLGDKVLPLSEIKFDGLPDDFPKIVTYEGKWMAESVYYKHTKPECPAKLEKSLEEKINETALAAFEAMNCRDYARVDMRLSHEGIPYVIEVNPNPDISQDSGFMRAAAASGMSYSDLLSTIAGFVLTRKSYGSKVKAS